MIAFQIEFNFGDLKKSLKELELKLTDLRRPMQAALDEIRQIQKERFDEFDAKFPNNPFYKAKKGGLPTGVKTGALKRAFHGGKGRISSYKATYTRGMELVWGIDMDAFTNGYPEYFDGWLRDRGGKLIDLPQEQFERIAVRFKAELDRIIEGYGL
jgi:hypothetical protein